jgi:uracil-DNA glycosylase family 4
MRLRDAFVTAVCRCAPPANRPTPDEMARCAPFLAREIDLLARLRVVIALGRIAWDALVRRAVAVDRGRVPRPRPAFGHGAETTLVLHPRRAPLPVLGSYHPSRQNTQTGRLTRAMFDRVIRRAAELAERG